MALLAGLLKEFYRCTLPYFPIVEEDTAADPKSLPGKLVGFLGRRDLDRWLTDLGRLGQEHKQIPRELLTTRLVSTELLGAMQPGQSILVLDRAGTAVAHWNESQLLQALSQLPRDTEIRAANQAEAESSHREQSDSRWLGKLLLRAFPWPLYACDLQGKTLFFNGFFENQILTKTKLKNSLHRVESYLIETVRLLLARSFSEDPQRKYQHSVLSTYDNSLGHYLRIVNLEEKGRVYGYFFIFQEGSDPGFSAEVNRRLNSGVNLDKIIDEIEGQIIFNALEQKGQNVSHAAQTLKIKRSTLQGKIQRLEIDKRFGRLAQGPVRRNSRLKPPEVVENQKERPKKSKTPPRSRTKVRPASAKAKKTRVQLKAKRSKKVTMKTRTDRVKARR